MATRCENSLDQRKQYAKEEQKHQPEGGNNKPKREWTRFKNRNGDNKNFKPGELESAKGSLEKIQANATSITFGFLWNPNMAGHGRSGGRERIRLIAIDYHAATSTARVESKGDQRSKVAR